jgi:polysaccharide biosynthesis/export protein
MVSRKAIFIVSAVAAMSALLEQGTAQSNAVSPHVDLPATAATPADSQPANSAPASVVPSDYSAGPDDLLAITVLEAPDLSSTTRVSATGEISLPLVGVFRVGGLAPRSIELLIEEQLRKTYMRDPHVSVQVTEVQSHPVSVMGAVNKPGTFQIRGGRSLLEVLSLAQGLAPDAGDRAIVTRKGSTAGPALLPRAASDTAGASPLPAAPDFVEVSLKELLQAKDPRQNIPIYPGDIVKVMSAGMVYIVGEVNKPGAFPMTEHEKLTVLHVLALGQGLTPTAAGKDAMIIRTLGTGSREQLPVNLSAILKGKSPDLTLQERDIVFIPSSTGKSVAHGTVDALVRMVTLRP